MSSRKKAIGGAFRRAGVGVFAVYLLFAYVLAGFHLGEICPLHGHHHGECPECRHMEAPQDVSLVQVLESEDGACAICQWLASQTPQPEPAPPVAIHCERIVRSFLHIFCPLPKALERVPSPRGPPAVA